MNLHITNGSPFARKVRIVLAVPVLEDGALPPLSPWLAPRYIVRRLLDRPSLAMAQRVETTLSA